MRFNYKIIPVKEPHPAFPDRTSHWIPVVPVRLSYGHGPQSRRFEALIDSGAADCLFHADIASALQIKIDRGTKADVAGIVRGIKVDAYFHDVSLWVGAGTIRIKAGFVKGLPVAGLLGRRGFFENFIVTFDPSATPPGFDLERLGRALPPNS